MPPVFQIIIALIVASIIVGIISYLIYRSVEGQKEYWAPSVIYLDGRATNLKRLR